MPPLGPNIPNFEKTDNRIAKIEAVELVVTQIAHSLIEKESPSRWNRVTGLLGKIARGGGTESPARSNMAIYEVEENDEKVQMAAYFSEAAGGCLFTQKVLGYDNETGEPKLGYLTPRAAIPKDCYLGFPLLAVNEEGNLVPSDSMTLEQRETFIQDVYETLLIIRAQSDAKYSAAQHTAV